MDIQNELEKMAISSEVRFYTVEDISKMSGWGENVVLKMFNDPAFPSADFGRAKIVEAHALIDYFSRRRSKKEEKHWVRGGRYNEIKKRIK